VAAPAKAAALTWRQQLLADQARRRKLEDRLAALPPAAPLPSTASCLDADCNEEAEENEEEDRPADDAAEWQSSVHSETPMVRSLEGSERQRIVPSKAKAKSSHRGLVSKTRIPSATIPVVSTAAASLPVAGKPSRLTTLLVPSPSTVAPLPLARPSDQPRIEFRQPQAVPRHVLWTDAFAPRTEVALHAEPIACLRRWTAVVLH
jgi:hypothetical protein